MGKLLKQVRRDKATCWRIAFIILNAFFSVLCILITQDMLVSILFVVGIAIIDVLVEMIKYISLKKSIKIAFSIKICWYYIGFIILALLPTIIGIIGKEFEVQQNLPGILFVNAVPNVLGALIVCSIIEHISKFDYKENIYLLIKGKKNYINIFIRLGFLGCFLNATNYKVNEKWNLVNAVNGFYLFIIIFCGVIVLSSFVIRLADKRKFESSFEKVYPQKTLLFGGLFLVSCGIGPLFFKQGKHEPILLAVNSITACTIIIFLAVFISRRTENVTSKYSYGSIIAFIAGACINVGFNFYKWDKSGDWLQQIFSGVAVFAFVLGSLLWANRTQKAANKSLK